MHWNGKSAVVTGAGSGIGKALSHELARRGAVVWMSDINGDAVREASSEAPGETHPVELDVVDADAVREHINDVATSHGSLDFVFNNAGIGVGGDVRELNLDHYNRSIDVNVRGVIHGILAAYPIMLQQRGGHIISTASAAGLLALPLMAPYSMTKHAVVGLVKSLRFEGASHNVRFSALCPTAIETPLLDNNDSEELGASWRPDIRSYLTKVGGAPYPVDRFVNDALAQIEKNRALVIAPLGARLRSTVARWFPGLVDGIIRRAYDEEVAKRPAR